MCWIKFGNSVTNANFGGKHRQGKFHNSNPVSFSFNAIHIHQDRIYVSYTCFRSTHSLCRLQREKEQNRQFRADVVKTTVNWTVFDRVKKRRFPILVKMRR